jgi:hypothetical protein
LQNGQEPPEATMRVAAGAVVASKPMMTASTDRILVFTSVLQIDGHDRSIRDQCPGSSVLNVNSFCSLDLRADSEVSY